MRRILLIDDDEDFRNNVAELLQLSDYFVYTASDGRRGIEKAIKEKPDLIICDIAMPQMDGFSVLHILSRHPQTVSIPFIIMTGRNELSDIRKGMGMGADDYLVKPFDEIDLLNSIEMRLSRTTHTPGKLSELQQNILGFIKEIQQKGVADIKHVDTAVQCYKKKDTIYSSGQKGAVVYFVINGKIKEFMVNDEGKELITNIYAKGDFLGYSTILEDTNYYESAQVIEDTELLLIPKKEFIQLINTNIEIANEFIGMLSRNLSRKDQKLVQLAYNSLRKKVATGIIEVYDKFRDERNGKPVIEISRQDLANIVGIAQESLSRTLKEFKDEQLIHLEEGNIVIMDDKRLRNLLY